MAASGRTSATVVSGLLPLPLLAGLEARLADVPSGDLGQELVELSHLMDRLESVRLRVLRRFDEAKAYESEGTLSAVSWLRWMCRLPAYGAIQRLSMARQLDDLPDTAAALASGQIGYQHAALIYRVAEQVGPETVRKDETYLIETAKLVDPGRFGLATADVRYRADARGVMDEVNQQHDQRQLWIRQMFDGHYQLEGRLDREGGAILTAALDAVDAPPTDVTISYAHRRADALVDLAGRLLNSDALPDVGGQRPHLNVTATVETLAKFRDHSAGTIEDGATVPAETVRRIACDSMVTRILLSSDGQPLEVGRTTRIISSDLRKALVFRDKGCRFPGCNRPAKWCDAHHMKHWADGGATNLGNVILLCRRHHNRVHEQGWQVAWTEDGRIVAIPPDPRRVARPNTRELARAG
jgi:hypothetical protein